MEFQIIKFIHDHLEIEVNLALKENSLWLTMKSLCLLFNRDKSVISRHIHNIFDEGELKKTQVVAKNATTASDGKVYQVDYYNIDVVLALGYRVRSQNGLILKEWFENYLINERKTNDIIVYNDGNLSIDVRIEPEEETVWLSVNQISMLFDTSIDNVYLHIKNIYQDGEIDNSVTEDSSYTQKEMIYVASDNKQYRVTFYNLDMILAVGYRIKSKRAIAFRRWANLVLKQYLLKGYVIDERRTLVSNENYLELVNKVMSIDNRVLNLEKRQKYQLIEDKLIYDGKLFDALALISKIIETAATSILLIDPYVDISTLATFKNKSNKVELIVITSINKKLSNKEIDTFNHDYGGLTIKIDNRYHDRYLIIDDKVFYHVGTSLNHIGKRLSQITLINDQDVINTLKIRTSDL